MPLIPTTEQLAVEAALTAHTFVRLEVGQGNRAVPADVTTGWNVTDLLTPFNPAREKANPPGGASGNVHIVDYQDGLEGDAVAYDVHEIGLLATPDGGGAEYLAYYESKAAGAIFSKSAGAVILRRLRLLATAAQLANSTFNVSLTAPAATEEIAGVVELADDSEVDADEANAVDNKVPTVAKLWRWFTGARILARVQAMTAAQKTALRNAIAGLTVSALADGANIVWDWNDGEVATVTLGGNRTLSVPTNGRDNELYLLRVTQDATGSRTLTLHASIDQGGRDAPSLSTAAGAMDVLGFMKWGGTVHYLGILEGY